MKSILEIPVFAQQDYFYNLINSSGKEWTERKYHDFTLFEYDLDKTHSLFFYLLKSIPEFGVELLIDQVIPKAPFSLMVLESVDKIDEDLARSVFISYHERYSTPLYICTSKENSDGLNSFLNSLSFEKFGSRLLYFENENNKTLNEIVSEVIRFMTSAA
jgi:hypothetical protein